MRTCVDDVARGAASLSNEIGRRDGQWPLILMDYLQFRLFQIGPMRFL